jgi:hypothetical protein
LAVKQILATGHDGKCVDRRSPNQEAHPLKLVTARRRCASGAAHHLSEKLSNESQECSRSSGTRPAFTIRRRTRCNVHMTMGPCTNTHRGQEDAINIVWVVTSMEVNHLIILRAAGSQPPCLPRHLSTGHRLTAPC